MSLSMFKDISKTGTEKNSLGLKNGSQASADILGSRVPKLDLSTVEPEIDSTSEEDEDGDEDVEYLVHGTSSQNENLQKERLGTAEIEEVVSNAKRLIGDMSLEASPGTPVGSAGASTTHSLANHPTNKVITPTRRQTQSDEAPHGNKTLKFLSSLSMMSSYTKQALVAAEQALFSPQEFHDVNQQTSDEESDDEPLIDLPHEPVD